MRIQCSHLYFLYFSQSYAEYIAKFRRISVLLCEPQWYSFLRNLVYNKNEREDTACAYNKIVPRMLKQVQHDNERFWVKSPITKSN